jgi:ABC-2 type transport system permease protein
MKNIGKYTWIGYTSARANLAYTGEVVARTVFMAVILYIFLKLWITVYGESGNERIGGLTLPQMIWYLMITECFWMSSVRLASEVDDDVRTGRLAIQLTKPLSYPCALLGKALGERAVRFTVNLVVGTSVALLLVGPIPLTIRGLLMFAMILPMAFVLDALGLIVVGLFAFWFESTMGLAILYSKTVMLAGGTMLPLEVYPAMWRAVFFWLPFASMVYGPARMLVAPDAALLQHMIVVQGIAVVALIGVVVLVQSAALRRIHSHGG